MELLERGGRNSSRDLPLFTFFILSCFFLKLEERSRFLLIARRVEVWVLRLGHVVAFSPF